MNLRKSQIKDLILAVLFCAVNCSLQAQQEKYYRQLRYNHVSPYVDILGIHPIDSITADNTSHYIFKYNKDNKLYEIVNNHYFAEQKHPLTSLGAYRVVFEYINNTETRVFYDPNGKRVANLKGVFKEVYVFDKNKEKKQLKFYDLSNKQMESNWGIFQYNWEKKKKYVIERRYNLKYDPINLAPYFNFGVTGIVLSKKGNPKIHFNLNEDLKISENSDGIAYYTDDYDEKGNHITFSYRNIDNKLVESPWNFALGEKLYDSIGNNIKLIYLNTERQVLTSRDVYSNVFIKKSHIASKRDSIEIRKKSLNYLVALQKLNSDLMDTVLNDSLNKMTIGYDRVQRKEYGRSTTKNQIIEYTNYWNKSGDRFPFKPINKVQILDVYDRVASVKLISDNWMEYLHLVKLNGSWQIINILWQHKDLKKYPKQL
ncbi:MAG: nuclear transport factor 2 family protein [Flavobacteriaceae bacterium]|nr:nuclear transport factor 2 family protein [Flavobacteriaceae bacterium]